MHAEHALPVASRAACRDLLRGYVTRVRMGVERSLHLIDDSGILGLGPWVQPPPLPIRGFGPVGLWGIPALSRTMGLQIFTKYAERWEFPFRGETSFWDRARPFYNFIF